MKNHKETVSDLLEKIATLRSCFEDTIWMAIRYAHGRSTYAPSMVRLAVEAYKEVFPDFELKADHTINKTTELLREYKRSASIPGDFLEDLFKDAAGELPNYEEHYVISVLFARWLATGYADEHLDFNGKYQGDEGFNASECLSVLNMKNSYWYKDKLDVFLNEVYHNYVKSVTVKEHIKAFNNTSLELKQIDDISRVEVIDKTGRAYVWYGNPPIQMALQDRNRTLKIFLDLKKGESNEVCDEICECTIPEE